MGERQTDQVRIAEMVLEYGDESLASAGSDSFNAIALATGYSGDEVRRLRIILRTNFPEVTNLADVPTIILENRAQIEQALEFVQGDDMFIRSEALDRARTMRDNALIERIENFINRLTPYGVDPSLQSQLDDILIQRSQSEIIHNAQLMDYAQRTWNLSQAERDATPQPMQDLSYRPRLEALAVTTAELYNAARNELKDSLIGISEHIVRSTPFVRQYIDDTLRTFENTLELTSLIQAKQYLEEAINLRNQFVNGTEENKRRITALLVNTPNPILPAVIQQASELNRGAGFVTDQVTPTRRDKAKGKRAIKVGAKWEGVACIKEEYRTKDPSKAIYIPSDGHCYFKAVRKSLEWLKHINPQFAQQYQIAINKMDPDNMNLAGVKQDDLSLEAARTRAKYTIIDCLPTCPRSLTRSFKTKCSEDCVSNRDRLFYSVPPNGYGIPSEYHVFYDPKDSSVHIEHIGHFPYPPIDQRNHSLLIGMLRTKGSNNHAVLFKLPIEQGKGKMNYRGPSSPLTKEDIQLTITKDTTLNVRTIPYKVSKERLQVETVVVYDVETYTKIDLDRGFLYGLEKSKELVPYALGYMIVSFKDRTILSKPDANNIPQIVYREVILDSPSENLFTKFFHALENDPLVPVNVQIFAHNGNRFDNLFIKNCPSVRMLSQIGPDSKLKQLKVALKDNPKKEYTFKDTCPFIAPPNSLKVACNTFKTAHRKMDFDIVGWTYEQYTQYRYLPYQPTSDLTPEQLQHMEEHKNFNWRMYLYYDVLCLGELIIELEKRYFKAFGVSIAWATGMAGVAWIDMERNCPGMPLLHIPATPSLTSFFKESCYGGRVMVWKRFYEAAFDVDVRKVGESYRFYDKHNNDVTRTYGMIGIDMNSLYPSAYFIASFPVGPPRPFQGDNFELLNQNPHYIVEAIIHAPNLRYSFHPYRTTNRNVIYPSNTDFQGVYNDVDIREMLKDGFTIKKVVRAVYWEKGYRLFKYIIENLYNMRSYYKKHEDESKRVFETCVKTVLNSMFGKMLETIDESMSFQDALDYHTVPPMSTITHLPNGQAQIRTHLQNPTVRKPVHIGGYVTAHARAICNEIIRRVKPENIYYTDTDSFYIERRIYDEAGLSDSNDLGGYKNDYGDKTITEAIFLDNKRYMLKLINNRNPNLVSVCMKFNGLNFNNVKFDVGLRTPKPQQGQYIAFDFNSIPDSDHRLNFEDKALEQQFNDVHYGNPFKHGSEPELLTKDEKKVFTEYEVNHIYKRRYRIIRDLFNRLLICYSSKTQQLRYYNIASLSQYKEFCNTPEDVLEMKRNQANYNKWTLQNCAMVKYVIEQWKKHEGAVYINVNELGLQVDPHRRGHWVASDARPLPQRFYDIITNPLTPTDDPTFLPPDDYPLLHTVLNDQFYSLGYNPNQPEFKITETPFYRSPDNRIGFYRENQAKIPTYTHRMQYNRVCKKTVGSLCEKSNQQACTGSCQRSLPDRVEIVSSSPLTCRFDQHPNLATTAANYNPRRKKTALIKPESVLLISEICNPQDDPTLIQRVQTHFYLATTTNEKGERVKDEIVYLNPAITVKTKELDANGQPIILKVGYKIRTTGRIPFYYSNSLLRPEGYSSAQEILVCDINDAQVRTLFGENTPNEHEIQEITDLTTSLPEWRFETVTTLVTTPATFDNTGPRRREVPESHSLNTLVRPVRREKERAPIDVWRTHSLN